MKNLPRTFEGLKKTYQKRSMQFILSLSFTFVAIVIIFGIGIGFSRQYKEAANQLTEKNNTNTLNQMNLNLNNYLHNMMSLSNTFYYGIIKNTDFGKDDLRMVTDSMRLLYDSQESSLVSMSVFDGEGKVVAGQPFSKLKKRALPNEEEWFKKASSQIENVHFSTPHVEKIFINPDNVYHWVVSLSRSVELTVDGNTQPGVILVNMNFSGIEQICKNVDFGESGYVYIVDDKGEIIYHPRQQLIYGNIIEENAKEAAQYSDGSHMETFQGEERQITVKTVGYTGWKIVGVSPVSDFASIYTKNTYIIWLVVIVGMILLFFINLFVSSRVSTPIKKLEKSVQEIENMRLDTRISISGSYEVRHLGKTLQSMVDNMKRLMDDIVKEQEGKRISEMDALQSQINPHFLYNTLDSVVWMIENERYEGAIVMITALAKLFRISLSKGKNIITIGGELQHVENYLIIQNVRYKNKFVYHINVKEELLLCGTIKLIIQPIVENAIYHGMEYMDGEGVIDINVYEKEDGLYIDVEDNGPGMQEEMVEEINQGTLRSTREKGSGIGIANVRERIHLYVGQEYGLTVFSEPDEGTLVQVHLPKLTLEEFEERAGNRYEK